jgi:hypothetical protein
MGGLYVMIGSELRVKLDRAARMSDDSTLRTCGLWNFYRANEAAFNQVAYSIYTEFCNGLRRAAQKSGATSVPPFTLADCQNFSEKAIVKYPIYWRLRVKSSLNPSEKQGCYNTLARYLVQKSWNSLVNQNPCL